MAKTYEQLQRKIQALQAEAETLRQQEVEGVVARIREAIVFYELTPADLGFGADGLLADGPGVRRLGAARRAAGRPTTVAYSNGAGGTWAGRGKRPQWLRDALAAGHTLDEFKVAAE
jgi:DNA-binding protein H-NS